MWAPSRKYRSHWYTQIVQSVLLGVNRVSQSHIKIYVLLSPANSTPSKRNSQIRVCTGHLSGSYPISLNSKSTLEFSIRYQISAGIGDRRK